MAWKKLSYGEMYSCESTDAKDTAGVPEGSKLAEVQPDGTVKFYIFLQGGWREL